MFVLSLAVMSCNDSIPASLDKSGAEHVDATSEALTTTLNWSGYQWNVRSGYGMPGPNNWGATSSSVYVDSTDSLNLTVVNQQYKNPTHC